MKIISESDLNKGQKLIRILQRLQRPEGARASELLQDFALNERSLRRYMTDLREIGVPVNKKSVPVSDADIEKNSELCFTVDAGFQREGIQITLLEWISIRFGRNMFTFLEGTNFSEDFDEALDKLSSINVGGTQQHLTEDMDRKFMNIAEHTKDHTDQSEIIDDIITCLLHQNPAEAFYARIGARVKTYTLHPYTLVTFRQGLYLFAWDVEAQQMKTFAVERFHRFKRDRHNRFTIPLDYKPQDIVKDSFGIIKGTEPEMVKLRFSKNATPYIQERTWHHSQKLEPAPKSEIVLTLNVGIAYELKQWILGFGPDVTVLSPPSLVEYIADAHRRALTNYTE